MIKNLSITVAIVLSLCQASLSQSEVKFTLAPQVSQSFGYTEYIMDLVGHSDTGLVVLGSKLEFPLDVLLVGAKFRMRSIGDSLGAWWIEGAAFTNVDDPERVMKDTDWTKKRANLVLDDSYTESRAQMSSILLTIEAARCVVQRENVSLAAWAGFRYHRIEQDITGWEGWYIDSLLVLHRRSGTKQGIFYRVTYKLPHVGLLSEIKYHRRISLELKAAYALVLASDFDDHLLRHKDATASMTGHGILSGANIRCRLPVSGKVQPFFELVAGFAYLHASGSQTQTWYGDDPITPDVDDTGTIRSGIPHEVTSRQAYLGLKVGLGF